MIGGRGRRVGNDVSWRRRTKAYNTGNQNGISVYQVVQFFGHQQCGRCKLVDFQPLPTLLCEAEIDEVKMAQVLVLCQPCMDLIFTPYPALLPPTLSVKWVFDLSPLTNMLTPPVRRWRGGSSWVCRSIRDWRYYQQIIWGRCWISKSRASRGGPSLGHSYPRGKSCLSCP